MAGLVGDLAGQFMRFGHVLGQREQLLAAPTAHADPRGAPAHPAHRAIAAQQAALPRFLQPHPVDGAALVHGQVIDVEHIGQTLHAQLRQRHAQDPAQRLVGLGEASLAIHLEHADHRLVEGQTELAFGVAHSPQGAAHHVQGVSTQQDEGGRTERQQHASQEVRALGQRAREGQLLRSQARIDGGELPLVGEHAGLIGHAPRPMGFQRIGQHDQLVDLGLRLPPQAHRFAEVRRIVQQAVHPDQAFDVLRCIAALQEPRTRRREVDRVALQGLASGAVAQRHAERFPRVGQVRRVSMTGITVEAVHGALLRLGPMALAHDVRRRARLRLEYRGDQQRAQRRQGDEHRHAGRQPPQVAVVR